VVPVDVHVHSVFSVWIKNASILFRMSSR
jgi:hypothetical protein